MRSLRPLALLFLVFLSQGWAQEETLRKGDQIIIDIKGVPLEEREQVHGTYTISDEGTLELYLIGTVRAFGEKPSTLSTKIERSYIQNGFFTHPNVIISRDSAQENRFVTIIGEVQQNGAIRYQEGLSLLEVISMSGGFTGSADVSQVKLVRDDQARIHDCQAIVKNPELDVVVLPGDKIFVPQNTGRVQPNRSSILDSFRR